MHRTWSRRFAVERPSWTASSSSAKANARSRSHDPADVACGGAWLILPTQAEVGQVVFFRGRRLSQATAGSGALGDLGSHVVDLARFLIGEPASVSATLRTFTRDRPGGRVDVDDAFAATVEFASGTVGTLEASRVATGHRNGLVFEVNGANGSLRFNLERLNELEVCWLR